MVLLSVLCFLLMQMNHHKVQELHSTELYILHSLFCTFPPFHYTVCTCIVIQVQSLDHSCCGPQSVVLTITSAMQGINGVSLCELRGLGSFKEV